jgi:hypothetical protein
MTHGGYSSKNGTAYVAKCIVASGVLLCIAVRHRGETFSWAEPLLLSTCSAIFIFSPAPTVLDGPGQILLQRMDSGEEPSGDMGLYVFV